MLPRQMSLWTWTRDHVGEGGVYVGWLNHRDGHAIGVIWLTGIVVFTLVMAMQ